MPSSSAEHDQTERRADAVAAWRAGLNAVEASRATTTALARRPDVVPSHASTVVVAVGKAAAAMMRGALPVARGIVLVPVDVLAEDFPSSVTVLRGGHPLPTPEGIASSRAILHVVASLGADDTLLVLLSGGASALLEVPVDGMSDDDLIESYRRLVGSGSTIAEINAVRACLSTVKAGGLARHAAPARVVTLAISDVLGDDPATIGSGPTIARALDPRLAWEGLQSLGLSLPARVEELLATSRPASPADLPESEFEIIARAEDAAAAASALLAERGYHVTRAVLGGDTADAAAALAQRIDTLRRCSDAQALVATGETAVKLPHVDGAIGIGGRNLDLAARLATALASADEDLAFACVSAGTDGRDGSSHAAGAIVDHRSSARAEAAGVPFGQALALFDTEPAVAASGDLLVTGPTGTNVGDLLIAVAGGRASGRRSC